MSESTICSRCGTRDDASSSFCAACGASLAPQVHCPACNTLNALGQAFCTRCGGSLEHAGWNAAASAAPGAVIDGVWERGGDELIRRVDPEDARRFLGGRTVRVPAGTVGVVVVDGVVERVLPPGEQTSLGVFERIANFFLRRDRTAFYLVDQRPFPVPFVVTTRPSATGQALKSQVLVTFTLPKGDRTALASFLANVVGERPSYSMGELYNLLRPEVARIAQTALERAVAAAGGVAEVSYADAEVEIRRELAAIVGPRYGLTVDATLAPLTAIASVTLHLGTGPAPSVRPCVSCKHELPASLRFCDVCGAKQPAVIDSSAPASMATALFTADGQQVELDVVVRVSGQHDDFGPARIAPALVGAMAASLRDTPFAALTGAGGFTALEAAAKSPVAEALAGFGLALVAIAVVDARSKTGQWLLRARADLDRATEDVRLGLSWLEQRDHELDLEQLTLTRALRAQVQKRDAAFASDDATLGDRERRDGLAARAAVLDVSAAQRQGMTRAAADAVEHERQRREVAQAAELRRGKLDSELDEQARRKRLAIELEAAQDATQLDKLRALAAIDRETTALEHAQDLEKRTALRGLSPDEMIAVQAAELARTEGGGAAWASALAARGGAEQERRHAEETRAVYDQAMGAMADVAKSRAEAAPVVAGGGPVVTIASTETGGKGCTACGTLLRPGAKFCTACGATQA